MKDSTWQGCTYTLYWCKPDGVFSPSVAAVVVLWWSCTVGLSQPPDAVGTVVSCELTAVAQLLWAGPLIDGRNPPLHTHTSQTGPQWPRVPFAVTRYCFKSQQGWGEGGGCSHRHGHLRSPQSVSRPVLPGHTHTLIKGLHSANRPGKSLHPALF